MQEPHDPDRSLLRRLARSQRLRLRASTMLLLCVPAAAAVSIALNDLGRGDSFPGRAYALAPMITLLVLVFASVEFLHSCCTLMPQAQLLAEVIVAVGFIGLMNHAIL